MASFSDFDLDRRLLDALKSEGYTTPTPVQAATIPALLDGRDVLGVAQTGTGKTAAFSLPILHQLAQGPGPSKPRPIRALILSPTRELAAQLEARLRIYGADLPLFSTVIFGGVGQSAQVKALRRGVDVLVATPGRLLDLYDQGFVDLSYVEHFVLDEADRMLDMGFSNDVDRILALMPPRRQNLLFSATMPDAIQSMAGGMLVDPVSVDINPEAPTVDRIEQFVMFVAKSDKKELLIDLLEGQMVSCGIVFTRTKHGANRLARQLNQVGISSDSIHGDKSQTARTQALKRFREGDIFILVATALASRGSDVAGVTHVFNFDLPNEPEVYVHRIGRTGRAGRAGLAYAFCDESESGYLIGIQRLLGHDIEVVEDQPYHFPKAIPSPDQKPGRVKGFTPNSSRSNRGTGRGRDMRRYHRGKRPGADQGGKGQRDQPSNKRGQRGTSTSNKGGSGQGKPSARAPPRTSSSNAPKHHRHKKGGQRQQRSGPGNNGSQGQRNQRRRR